MDILNKVVYKGYTLRSLLYYTSMYVHSNNFSTKDKMAGPKHVHYSEDSLYIYTSRTEYCESVGNVVVG